MLGMSIELDLHKKCTASRYDSVEWGQIYTGSYSQGLNYFKFHVVTARKRSLGQGNIFSSVCQEFCSQGRGVPGQVPPWAGTPQAGTPLEAGAPPGQVHPQAGTSRWAGTPLGGTTRSSACWEIRATSGRYASYWNAFLLIYKIVAKYIDHNGNKIYWISLRVKKLFFSLKRVTNP